MLYVIGFVTPLHELPHMRNKPCPLTKLSDLYQMKTAVSQSFN